MNIKNILKYFLVIVIRNLNKNDRLFLFFDVLIHKAYWVIKLTRFHGFSDNFLFHLYMQVLITCNSSMNRRGMQIEQFTIAYNKYYISC